MTWTRASIAEDGTHHVLDGRPLYATRFSAVQKFHQPGLAPVVDHTGAFHIRTDGSAAYPHRFLQAWGFYEERAAVEDAQGWFHIRPDGAPVTPERYAWCGNFQEGRCASRGHDGRYRHLAESGEVLDPVGHRYCGDFRDGAAVVRSIEDGLCRHVGRNGSFLHGGSFLDLDVYHKGFARARDEAGWHHIDRQGQATYESRFAAVEPFYNGSALCETLDGRRVLIGVDGAVRATITEGTLPLVTSGPDAKVIVIGNIGSGKSTVSRELVDRFAWTYTGIDDCRRRWGDGSPAGELRAWAGFVEAIQRRRPVVVEFSGSGPMVHLTRLALQHSRCPVLVLWVRTPVESCLARVAGRVWTTPYPDFGVPIDAVIRDLDHRLESECGGGLAWPGCTVRVVNGAGPEPEMRREAADAVTAWFEGCSR